jgi:hypothetical protein
MTVATLFPRLPVRRVAVTAGLFSMAVELSQLYHAPWIHGLRRIRLAALLLGHDFLWSDLACYGVGVCVGMLAETLGYGSVFYIRAGLANPARWRLGLAVLLYALGHVCGMYAAPGAHADSFHTTELNLVM